MTYEVELPSFKTHENLNLLFGLMSPYQMQRCEWLCNKDCRDECGSK